MFNGMSDNWDLPLPRETAFAPRNLDALSVHELDNYIADLKTEIERVTAEIGKKQQHKDAMAALFKN